MERVTLSVLTKGGYWVDLPANTLEEAAREFSMRWKGEWRASGIQPLSDDVSHPVARRRFREYRVKDGHVPSRIGALMLLRIESSYSEVAVTFTEV